MEAPLVSVIVPTKNSVRTAERCFQSIKSQVYSDVELIVVDNFSTDGTFEIAQRIADIVIQRGPERSSQRNAGASVAKGEYVLFIDSDMYLSDSVIGSCVAMLQKKSDCQSAIIPEKSIGTTFIAKCKALERQCYIGDDSIEAARFFSLKNFWQIGGYNELVTGVEDWDLSDRMLKFGHHCRISDLILHDEGELRLKRLLGKKYYYGKQIQRYVKKGLLEQRSLSVVRPAFFRNIPLLMKTPLVAVGMIGMKSLEYLFGGAGYFVSMFTSF